MKKIIVTIITITCLAALTGCNTQRTAGDEETQENSQEETTQEEITQEEATQSESADKEKAEKDAVRNTQEDKTSGNANSEKDAAYIGEDAAKAIALERAGVTESQVKYTGIEFEFDDGIAEYQIDFVVGTTEYEVEIHAVDGTILQYEYESIYD